MTTPFPSLPAALSTSTETTGQNIAIVGMACRLPGAVNSPADLWRLLVDRVDTVRDIPEGRWDADLYYHPEPGRAGRMYSRRGSFLDGVDLFDANFFGIAPREADCIDPQQRLLLELSWEALEDAGIPAVRLAGSDTSVYIGICTADYGELSRADPMSIEPYTGTGGAMSVAANRISYIFDFHGPSIAIDTACSSSLVAIHLACESLARGESSVALAGGVNLIFDPTTSISFSRANMLSPRGRCSSFDARADGFVRSEGGGLVLLKPLATALADGDLVHAVIRATEVNQDGRTTGISLPNEEAQAELLRRVYARAEIAPHDVHYVEAHGTGTPAGDPVECGAIGRVLGAGRRAGNELRIGSIKSNIGHCEAASGIAGLMKAVLALRHRYIPASLHCTTPNPKIPFGDLGLIVARDGEPWPALPRPAIAGVNSFGFGGTSAHVVVEEFRSPSAAAGTLGPVPAPEQQAPRPLLLPISARTPAALHAQAECYRRLLDETAPVNVCHTISRHRDHHPYRLAAIGATAADLSAGLDAYLADEGAPGVIVGERPALERPRVAYAFSGNGSQWWAMGRQLLDEHPVFAEAVAEYDGLLQRRCGLSVLAELRTDEETSRMTRTDVAQPALLAVQLGLVAMLRSWGIEPSVTVGHSVGEVAAAYVSGILDLEQAVEVIYHRSRVQELTAGTGRMVAVGLPEDDAREVMAEFGAALELAAVNSPQSVTLSGDVDTLDRLLDKLKPTGVFTRMLPLNYAFHSSHMDPVREQLLDALTGLTPRTGVIPMVSTVTGEEVDGADLDAGYWWRNIRRPIAFAAAVAHIAAQGPATFLEIGPHPVLRSYLAECLRAAGAPVDVLTTLRRETPELPTMLRAAGQLYTLGYEPSWGAVNPPGQRCTLPPYPWQRERYWHQTGAVSRRMNGRRVHPLLGYPVDAAHPTYANQIDTEVVPYLADHRIEGEPVFPAAGYIELALAAVSLDEPETGILLEDLQIRRPLLLHQGHMPTVQVSLQSPDGVLAIDSRESSEGAWQSHVLGQARRCAPLASREPLDVAGVRARCTTVLDPGTLYDLATRSGLQYGPSFRTVREVRSAGASEKREFLRLLGMGHVMDSRSLDFADEVTAATTGGGVDEVFGTVELGEDVETAGYRLHPALLDGCFQSMLPLVLGDGTGPSFLPVGVRRLRLHTSGSRRVHCHTRLIRRGATSLELDLSIVDEAGMRIADLVGFRLQAVNLGAGHRTPAEDDVLYEEQVVPMARGGGRVRDAAQLPTPDELDDPDELIRDYAELRLELAREEHYRSVVPAMNRLTTDYLIVALDQLGWRPLIGDSFTTDQLAAQLRVSKQHRQLLGFLLGFLAEDGVLQRTPTGWAVARTLQPADPGGTWAELAVTHPAHHADLLLLARCGTRLAAVLTGEADPLEILFNERAAATLDHFYSCSGMIRLTNELMGALYGTITGRLPADRPLRILEIGAGTGGTTGYVLPWLPSDRTEYVFTDVSEAFLRKASERFREYPFVRYQVLDIERDPSEQGFDPHSFDLILASNVIHATRDLTTTLNHVKGLLASQGLVSLVEVTNAPRMMFAIFGLLRGLWVFEDRELRPDQALLTAPAWRRVLADAGFADVRVLAEQPDDPEVSILLARGPAVAESARSVPGTSRGWLVFVDEQGAAIRLADELAAAGDVVVQVTKGEAYHWPEPDHAVLRAGSAADLELLLTAVAESGQEITDIVHAWSLDADDLTAEALDVIQRDGCLSLVQLVQLVQQGQWHANDRNSPRLWLVTAGARARRAGVDPVTVAQAPLIGLRRVIGNEHPELRCTLVDLSPAEAKHDAEWSSLADELRLDSAEDEVLLRGQDRYVSRVQRRKRRGDRWLAALPPAGPGTAGDEEKALVLRIGIPGVLDSLHWQATARPVPGPGEVAIQVEATGLNFKDVMHALGLLPAEAVETSYAGGLCLGFECAGRIVAVGAEVSGLAVGEEVIAVARNALATHVIAEADLVVRKPAGLGFEQAATLFAAFVTAHYGLRWLARLRSGERLLVHHASGGVGLAAIQIAQDVGAEVFATAGSPEKREFLRLLGVDHVMDSRSLDFADEVTAATTGGGVDVVLNSLTGDGLQESLRLLRRFGRFIELGKQDLLGNSRLGLLPFERCLSLHAVDVDQMMLADRETVSRLMAEITALIEDGTYRPLAHRTFPAAQVTEAFRFMQQSRHKGKVVVSLRDAAARLTETARSHRDLPAGLKLREDGLYIVSGGLGGFGLATARWLVERGARQVALLGRRDPASADGDPTIATMRAAGAEVIPAQVDVTDRSQVRDFLASMREEGRAVRGVVHAAMVLADALVNQLDADGLDRGMAPKVLGAWHLHVETLADPVELFIMYSSLTSVIGNAGQANYVAGNSFLDEFAAYRRALGLPALTVNWGGIGEVGFVARQGEAATRLTQRGVGLMAPDQAFAALERLLAEHAVTSVVGQIDWHRVKDNWTVVSPRWAALLPEGDQDGAGAVSAVDLVWSALKASPETRAELVVTWLVDQLSRVLDMAPSNIDPDRPMADVGLDSLMAMELLIRIKSDLGIDVPVLQLAQDRTLREFAGQLEEQLVSVHAA